MNIDIEKILGKYYEGTSSLEEEKTLRDFFAAEHVDEYFLFEKQMFELFNQEKQEKDTSSTKQFLQSIHPAKQNRFAPKKLLYFTSGIAVCLIFMIGIIFYQNDQKNSAYVVMNGIRINNKELAMELVNENLSKVSAIMDRGLAPLDKVQKIDNKLDSIVNSINY